MAREEQHGQGRRNQPGAAAAANGREPVESRVGSHGLEAQDLVEAAHPVALEVERHEAVAESLQVAALLGETIVRDLKAVGYRYVTLDLQGYRMGSLNEGVTLQPV